MITYSKSELYYPNAEIISVSFSILGWTLDYDNGLSQLATEELAMQVIAQMKREDEAYSIIAHLNS